MVDLLKSYQVWHPRVTMPGYAQPPAQRRDDMAAKKGDGLLMVYCDVAAEHEEEFNRWYNDEHIPERLAIPGVLSAARYKAMAGGPTYLACYKLASADAWHAEAWQQRLKHPTAWSKRMAPSVIGTAYIRNLYRRIYPQNVPAASVLLVGRMSVPAELEATFNEAYNHERLPLCLGIPGYIRARRFEAVMGAPKYTTVHEMTSPNVWKSQAWDDWRTAVTPVWNREIRPHMVHAEGSPGVYHRIFPA
jgi:hypothetical protein